VGRVGRVGTSRFAILAVATRMRSRHQGPAPGHETWHPYVESVPALGEDEEGDSNDRKTKSEVGHRVNDAGVLRADQYISLIVTPIKSRQWKAA